MSARSSTKNKVSDLNRRGFGLKKEITPVLAATYTSPLVDRIRENGYTLAAGETTLRLAKEFGFCYGVDRAVLFAYETRKKFPDRNIFLTTEIIHNPRVNRNLLEQGIRFLSGQYKSAESVEEIKEGDVVILPAFGATMDEVQRLRDRNCVLVDTTCGSVMNVWRHVERNAKDGFSSVIHGKKEHEETIATCSRAVRENNTAYIVVRNEAQTQQICDYIRGEVSRDTLLERLQGAYPAGFDPERHLQRIGVANQTTMLARESIAVSDSLESAMKERYGEQELERCFRKFDTICTATQERQDAILALGAESPDMFLVVGGFNSSNTTNLAFLARQYAPTYHLSDADCLISKKEIRHKDPKTYEIGIQRDWLPTGKLVVGLTAGASTPDKVLADVIERLLELRENSEETSVSTVSSESEPG